MTHYTHKSLTRGSTHSPFSSTFFLSFNTWPYHTRPHLLAASSFHCLPSHLLATFLCCHTPACLPIYQASSTLACRFSQMGGGNPAGSSLHRCSQHQQEYHNMGFLSIILLSQQPKTSFANMYKNPTLL